MALPTLKPYFNTRTGGCTARLQRIADNEIFEREKANLHQPQPLPEVFPSCQSKSRGMDLSKSIENKVRLALADMQCYNIV